MTSTDLEDVLGVVNEKQGLCFLAQPQIIETGDALARRGIDP